MTDKDIKEQSLVAYPPVYGKDSADIFAGHRSAWIEGARWLLRALLKESFRAEVREVHDVSSPRHFHVAKFAALFDKVSGRGTWESNPWVFVYEFELVK